MLAGDPHLPQTVPSIWYQVALSAPGLSVTGVSVPGLPGVLIGHNAHIAWSLTDTQNQATLFYAERTSKSRPGQYFWQGAWRRMRQVHYTIPVRGGSAVHLTVNITVHGPVMTQAGQTTSVDWMGNIPSPDISVMIGVTHARDFAQFHAALAAWRAPSQNFVYADDRGNIGAISAGYYPLVRHGDPWLPMPGTGADDVAGVIPYASVPQVYDPPGHVVATANQRPVGPSYPYYIGTSANFFDPGYRAGEIYASLRGQRGMRPASFAAIQLSLTDRLAQQIVPRLLAALRRRAPERTAAGRRPRCCTAGTPPWRRTRPPPRCGGRSGATTLMRCSGRGGRRPRCRCTRTAPGLAISPQYQFSLDQVLASWTTGDPANSAFSPPGGPHRTAPEVMRAAFATAVAHLARHLARGAVELGLGPDPLPAVPVGDPGGRARVRAARLRRRRLDGQRRRRRAGLAPGAELAHDRGVGRAWDSHGRGRVPGRAEREPGLALVRGSDGGLVGRPVPGRCRRPAGTRPARSAGACGHERARCAGPRGRWPATDAARAGAHEGSLAWLTCAGWASAAPTGWAGSAGRGRCRPRHRHRTTQASRRITGDRSSCGCWPAWPGW